MNKYVSGFFKLKFENNKNNNEENQRPIIVQAIITPFEDEFLKLLIRKDYIFANTFLFDHKHIMIQYQRHQH